MVDLVRQILIHLGFYYITEPSPLLYWVNKHRNCEIKRQSSSIGVHKEVTSSLTTSRVEIVLPEIDAKNYDV